MRFVTSICYGSVIPLPSTNQNKREKRKKKGGCHWNGEKKKEKTFTLAALEFFFWGKFP